MTASSEKFCLNWNDFQKNISSKFQEMRDPFDLAGVTLACEDKQNFKLCKLLSTSGSFFNKILMKSKHPHHLNYLKGLKAAALELILDFVWWEEVNNYQEDLNNFLVRTEELELALLENSLCKMT